MERHEFKPQWYGDICKKIPVSDGWRCTVVMKKASSFESTFAYVFQSIIDSC